MPVLITGFEMEDLNVYRYAGWSFSNVSYNNLAEGLHRTAWGAGGRGSLAVIGFFDTPFFASGEVRWVSFWTRRVDPTGNLNRVFQFSVGNTANSEVVLESDTNGAQVLIRRGSTTVATSVGTIDNSEGQWVEIEIVAQNSPNGLCNVYINGSLFVSASGVDLQQSSTADFDKVRFGASAADQYVDDVILTTQAEGRLSAEYYGILQPIVANQSVALTPSTDTNWRNVAYGILDTGVYNSTTAGAGAEDLYLTKRRAWIQSVYGVSVNTHVARQGQGSGAGNNLQIAVRSGSTTGTSTTEVLGASQYIVSQAFFATNPDTASAWTEDDLDDLAVGVRTAT